MIVVRIEVHSARTGEVEKKGVLTIANDGSGTPTNGHYTFKVMKHIGRPGVWKQGSVQNFPRSRLGPWDLLYRALREAVGKRNP
jgi:hypothetical protein